MDGTEIVIKKLTENQRNAIFDALESSEFYTFGRQGPESVYVRKKGDDYPGYGEGESVPVGFIGSYASLEYTDLDFPDDYHGRLKQIFLSVVQEPSTTAQVNAPD